MRKFVTWVMLRESTVQFDAFVQAILENHRDPGQILVFCDWLHDNGDEDLAEFARAVINRKSNKHGQMQRNNDFIKKHIHQMLQQAGIHTFEFHNDGIYFRTRAEPNVRRFYNLETREVQFTKSYRGGGFTDLVTSQKTKHKITRSREFPHSADDLPDETDPVHPKNWPVPWEGDSEEPTHDVLRGLFIAFLVKNAPSHLRPKTRYGQFQL